MPTVYSFHPRTRVFTGSYKALASPEEPHVFMLPAFATFRAAPAVLPGYKAVWNGESWDVVIAPDRIWLPINLMRPA